MPEDDFVFKPPRYEGGQGGFMPPNAHAAWMLKLIKLDLPEEIKEELRIDMVSYLDNASMTKITKGQVREFIGGFDELWLRYRTFKVRKKYAPELNYFMGYLKEQFILNLNKSVMGWQGDHVFEQKTTYDIKQTRKDIAERLKGILGGKKERSEEVVQE